MDQHPSSQELSDFLAGRLASPSQNRKLVRHLLAGCLSCVERLESLGRPERLPQFSRCLAERNSSAPKVASANFDYERAFANAERSLAYFVAQGHPVTEPPASILAELGSMLEGSEEISHPPPPARSALPFLVRWLVEKSHACRYTSPDEMLQWALMARIAADSCSKAIAGSAPKLADLRAHAEAQLANSLRVLGRSQEAEAVMGSAWESLAKGTGDSILRASVLAKSASLLILQDRFHVAFEHAREAVDIYDELGMKHERAGAQLTWSIGYIDSGEPDKAANLLEDVISSLDTAADSSLFCSARINLTQSYLSLKLPERALEIYEAPRFLCNRKDTVSLLRLRWLGGRLLVLHGRTVAAEHTFSRVRSGFLEVGLAQPLVEVTTDLVKLNLELGKRDAAEELVFETTAQVQAMRSGPEVLGFLQNLQSLTAPL